MSLASGSDVCQLQEVCSEANTEQILPVGSTVGHLVSQIHHWTNLEVKKCYPKLCLFSGDVGNHQFLLDMAVALKQERLAMNKSDLEIRRFLIIRTMGFWSSVLEEKKKPTPQTIFTEELYKLMKSIT